MSEPRNDQRRWQDDLVRRQRNIVFPDTVENEGRFWRGILSGERRLTPFQRLGTGVVLLLMVAIWSTVLLTMITGEHSDHPLWARVLNVAVPLAVATAVILAFMALIGWRMRRERGVLQRHYRQRR